jgi:putative FmdB family regulatory protein
MPIYDYRCDHCGHAFSQLQSFNEEALAACPNCGKKPRRLIATPSIVFKGSGWYKTDSRASGSTSKDDAPAKEAPAKDAPAKETTVKDGGATKPEATPEKKKGAAPGEAAS